MQYNDFYELHLMSPSARSVSPSLSELKGFSRDLERKMSGKHRRSVGARVVDDDKNPIPLDCFQVTINMLLQYP